MLKYKILTKIYLLKCVSEGCSSAVYIYHHPCSVVVLRVPVSLYCSIQYIAFGKTSLADIYIYIYIYIYDDYDVYSAINSHMFISTCWLYSRQKASLQVMKYLKQLILFYKFYKNYNTYHACVFGSFPYRQGYSRP